MANTKAPRKTTKPAPRRKKEVESVEVSQPVVRTQNQRMDTTAVRKPKKKQFWLIAGLLLLALLALAVMRYRYFLVPATVNGSPVFINEYLTELNQIAGRQAMDQLVTERLINDKAAEQNVTVSSQEIDTEMSELEKQFEAQGGLDTFLAAQGLSRDQVRRQLEINLKIQKMLADKVAVTDEEVNSYYEENAAEYEGVEETEAKNEIRETLKNQKLQTEVGPWIQQLKNEANVVITLPGMSAADLQ